MHERAVKPHPLGSVLEVRAQPGARREGLAGEWNGLPKLAVAAPPEDGRANESLQRLLATILELKPAQVSLLRGATSRLKAFVVELPPREVLLRLAKARDDLRSTPDGDCC
jgi:uncharacterized protein YggU (UPF0235/DUF167 family)